MPDPITRLRERLERTGKPLLRWNWRCRCLQAVYQQPHELFDLALSVTPYPIDVTYRSQLGKLLWPEEE